MKDLAILAGVPVMLAVILVIPGWLLGGEDSLRHCAVALGLCLLPAIVTFVLIQRLTNTIESRMLATLGSSMARMSVSLGSGLALYKIWPHLFPAAFLYWLVVFYLVVLGLEVWLLVRRSPVESDTVSS